MVLTDPDAEALTDLDAETLKEETNSVVWTTKHSWERLGRELSEDCFRGAPVDIEVYGTLSGPVALATIRFNPVKPDLPVTVNFRSSFDGDSLVAKYQNNSSEFLSLQVTIRSKTANQVHELTLKVGPNRATEHGWLEGWGYKSGESVSIINRHYKPLQIRVP